METLLLIFVVLLVARTSVQLWLDNLNRQEVRRHESGIPEAFAGVMDAETYQKAVRYTLDKSRLGSWETIYDAAVLAIVVLSGLLPWLWDSLTGAFGLGIWGQSGALLVIMMLLSLPGLPWEYYNQFKLEERYGFNQSNVALWLTDKVKGIALSLIIGVPLLALILWLVELSPLWWLWAFIALFAFQLLMLVLAPMVIMPLFNKFTDLPEGELRDRLMALADRTGFAAKTIQIMDGSKRSRHSNAFFTGFGSFRRIVLFDTLVEQLQQDELEAVLAHEIGHYRCGHIPKRLVLAAVSLFGMFALLGWLIGEAWFVEAFGFTYAEGVLGPTLLMVSLLSGLVMFWFNPLSNQMSRKHEYEADAFARRAMDNRPEPLIGALRGLTSKNLGNLTPHPLYSAFYYSHPTLLEREKALRESQA
ncbi:MAG: M48 family metallopeptidase [Verrucomicrobiota bacterium JB022]|nr:M48 family metallopeptidase [Verrucomicrobiota bacterium JB022]